MKKTLLMMVLMIVPFALQAQTKYHDVEVNDAKGAVKSITSSMMGQSQTITFTKDGKQEGLKNAVYDENGYLQSAEQESQMGSVKVIYKWENGKITTQTMDMMGQQMPNNNLLQRFQQFQQMFRKIVGVRPLDYRKQQETQE